MLRKAILAYGVLLVSCFVVNGLAMFGLARELTRSDAGAFVAGLAFAFAPYQASQVAHVQMLVAFGMQVPRMLEMRRYQLPRADARTVSRLVHRLSGLPGVREVNLGGEGVAYLKVDSKGFDEQNVIKLLAGET